MNDTHSLAIAVAEGTIPEIAAAAGLAPDQIAALYAAGHADAYLIVQLRTARADGSLRMTIREFSAWSESNETRIAHGIPFTPGDILCVCAEPSRTAPPS